MVLLHVIQRYTERKDARAQRICDQGGPAVSRNAIGKAGEGKSRSALSVFAPLR